MSKSVLGDGCGCFPTGRHYPGIAHLLRTVVRGIADEYAGDVPWDEIPIALLDVETTGRDASIDRIVEIGIVVGRGGEIVARHNWLVNPGCPIPEEARAVHGISDADVADAPRFEAIASEVSAALAGCVPAAYNAAFDRAFLANEFARASAKGQDLVNAKGSTVTAQAAFVETSVTTVTAVTAGAPEQAVEETGAAPLGEDTAIPTRVESVALEATATTTTVTASAAVLATTGATGPTAPTAAQRRTPPALRKDVDWVDPLVWARELQRDEKSKALGEVAARLGIQLENAHRASDDAEAALRVLYALGRDTRVPRAYGAFIQEQRRLAQAQADERRRWRS